MSESKTVTPTTLESIEAEYELVKAETAAIDAEMNLQARLASKWEAREYLFDGEINFTTLAACIETLDDWRRLDANRVDKNMHIVFNGSGSMIQAVALFDYLRWLKMEGFKITVEIAGRAGTQSALVLAAGDHRMMTPSSWLQIEEMAIGVQGSTFDGGNRLEWNKRLEAQMRRLLSVRGKLTPRQIANRTHLKSWNVTAEEALALGLSDEISTRREARLISISQTNLGGTPPAETAKQKKSVANIRKVRAEAALATLKLMDREATAANNGVVRFINTVNTTSVGKAKNDLVVALRQSDKDINLLINSNGGSVTDGLGFIDMCRQVKDSGRTINSEVIGYAASMGGVMLQCGKTRTMGRESWLLIHRVSSWFGNSTSDAQLSHDYCMQLQKQCFGILAERSVFTADEVQAHCHDQDWWLTAAEALKYGFHRSDSLKATLRSD